MQPCTVFVLGVLRTNIICRKNFKTSQIFVSYYVRKCKISQHHFYFSKSYIVFWLSPPSPPHCLPIFAQLEKLSYSSKALQRYITVVHMKQEPRNSLAPCYGYVSCVALQKDLRRCFAVNRMHTRSDHTASSFLIQNYCGGCFRMSWQHCYRLVTGVNSLIVSSTFFCSLIIYKNILN
jgi:hypothetical protein